ncbi:MAG: hypothetical protein EA421_13315 [Gemmatimonadales bacterium]|nr:MAG: hypothetical protein EA421_13315 [Gemmatimonadales bacterium]
MNGPDSPTGTDDVGTRQPPIGAPMAPAEAEAPTEESLAAHFRRMLPQARALSLDSLSADVWVGCVDGRHSECVAGAPGGNAGLLILLLATWEASAGRPFRPEEVEVLFLRYLDHFGSFYLHTDREAQERLAAALGREIRDVDALIRNPAPAGADQTRLLEVLLQPGHVGCGHLRLLLEEPGTYQVRRALVEEVLRNFYLRLWAGDARLILDILGGPHQEMAVARIRAAPGSEGLVTTCPRHGATELFVYHPDAVAWLHALHADFLATAGLIPEVGIPGCIQAQQRLGELQLQSTLERLAPGLPVFDVSVEADDSGLPMDVTVTLQGRVPAVPSTPSTAF